MVSREVGLGIGLVLALAAFFITLGLLLSCNASLPNAGADAFQKAVEATPPVFAAPDKLVPGASFGNMVCTAIAIAVWNAYRVNGEGAPFRIDSVFRHDGGKAPYAELKLTDAEELGFRRTVGYPFMEFTAEKKMAGSIWNYPWYVGSTELQQQYLAFWQAARPVLWRYFEASFPPPEAGRSTEPVIHIRLGDVPMNRHGEYHLVGRNTVRYAAAEILKVSTSVVVMADVAHNASDKRRKMAQKYLDMYVVMFKEEGLSVTVRSGESAEADITMMLYTPLLVQLMNSSFSFVTGHAKPEGTRFIRAHPYYEGKPFDTSLMPPGSFLPFMPVRHTDVVDYYDFDGTKDVLERHS